MCRSMCEGKEHDQSYSPLHVWCMLCAAEWSSAAGCSCLLQERRSGEVQAYNNVIQYVTLRTAVCEFLEMPQCPQELL